MLTADTKHPRQHCRPGRRSPGHRLLLSQQGLSTSHLRVPALLLHVCAALGRARQGCPIKHLVRAACSCSFLLWCVGSDVSAPPPSPRWQTKGLPTALTKPVPSCTCSEESFTSSSSQPGDQQLLLAVSGQREPSVPCRGTEQRCCPAGLSGGDGDLAPAALQSLFLALNIQNAASKGGAQIQ